MIKYKVSFELVLAEGNPRKWLAETISDALDTNEGEDILNMEIEEVYEPEADNNGN